MNCQEFWNTMPELGGPVHEHLEQCVACAARLRRQSALKAGLRAVAGQMSQVGAPARVESRLRAAFRAHHGIPAYVPVRPPHWNLPLGNLRRRRPILTWATAAAAAIGLAMFLVRQPEPALSVSHSPEIAMTDVEINRDTAVANSGFIALPNAAEIGPNEDVNMVRVEVPRSAMIALGFEVNPDQAWQPVQADVMLGADGLARAVRFLD
jgi:hypothetical protein